MCWQVEDRGCVINSVRNAEQLDIPTVNVVGVGLTPPGAFRNSRKAWQGPEQPQRQVASRFSRTFV